MEDYITNITVFGMMAWTILFLLTRKMFHKRSFEFCGHLVSIIQSSQFILLASYSVQDWTNPLSPLTSISSPLQMKILAADLAYYIYDLGRLHFDMKNIRVDMVFHHLITVAGIILGLAYKRCGTEAMAEIWIGELAAPLMYLRNFLKELGYQGTNIYLVVDIVHVAVFTFAKMICGTYFIYVAFTVNYPLIMKIWASAIQILYVFWFYKLVRMRMHKYLSTKGGRSPSLKTQ